LPEQNKVPRKREEFPAHPTQYFPLRVLAKSFLELICFYVEIGIIIIGRELAEIRKRRFSIDKVQLLFTAVFLP
jgi:hypothetical protein